MSYKKIFSVFSLLSILLIVFGVSIPYISYMKGCVKGDSIKGFSSELPSMQSYTIVSSELEKLLKEKIEPLKSEYGKNILVIPIGTEESLKNVQVPSNNASLAFFYAAFPEPKRILKVPENYNTIQEAIDAASYGDEIFIKKGVYQEALTPKNNIHLRGEVGVIIRSSSSSPVISIFNSATVWITDLTVENGARMEIKEKSPMLLVENSTVFLKNCVFHLSETSAIEVYGKSNFYVKDSLIQKNNGVGIFIQGKNVKAQVIRSKFLRNKLSGVFLCDQSSAVISKNYFGNNGMDGLAVTTQGTFAEVSQNQFSKNKHHGIVFSNGSSGVVSKNISNENEAGGITVLGKKTILQVSKNICKMNGRDGIHFDKETGGTIFYNFCEKNQGSGIFVLGRHTVVNMSFNKSANNFCYGVDMGIKSVIKEQGNIFFGNRLGQVIVRPSVSYTKK